MNRLLHLPLPFTRAAHGVSLVALFLATLAPGPASARDHRKKAEPESAPVAAPATPAVPAPAATSLVPLTVVCTTPGALVYVDGEQIAQTPMDLPVPVSPGDHSIKITRLGFAPYIDVFSTKGKTEVKVELELQPVAGVLHVKSAIAGARVLIDGRYVGEAPLDVEVDVGPRAVQVSKSCYKDYFQNLMAVAGQDSAVEVNLDELPAANNPCKPPPPEPQKWYKKGWVWGVVAVGVAAIAGGVAGGAYAASLDPLRSADLRFSTTALSVGSF